MRAYRIHTIWVRPRSFISATEHNMYARTQYTASLCSIRARMGIEPYDLVVCCVCMTKSNQWQVIDKRRPLWLALYTDTNAQLYHRNHDNKYLFNKHKYFGHVQMSQSMHYRTDRNAERYMRRTFDAIN